MEISKQFGGRLFDALFDDDVRAALRSSIRASEEQGAGLRIRLRFGNTPELADIPWEYLYDGGANRFLTLSRETPLVRYLDLSRPVEPLQVQAPLRILVMISDPSDYDRLDVEAEWQRLLAATAALRERGLVEIVRQDKATLLELQRLLRDNQFHIFHYIGHGVFDESADDGFLVLEEENGRGRKVSGQYVGTMLADHRSLRLAVLNSCEGGRSSRRDPYAGAAQSLVQQGLPAVIAMQFEISDDAAAVFAQEFYMALAGGYPVDAALAEGRRAIFATKTNAEWGIPVLFMRAADGRIFDVQAPVARPASPPPATPAPVAESVSPPSVVESPAAQPQNQPSPAGDAPTISVAPPKTGSEETMPASTVQIGTSVEWNKTISPTGSTPTDLRMVKIIGGVILGAFLVLALMFYFIFRNTTEQATPAALVPPTISFFRAEPSQIVEGENQSVQLSWSVSGEVTDVAVTGPGIDASLALSRTGSLLVSLDKPATFALTARNFDQPTTQQVTISAASPTPGPVEGASTPAAGGVDVTVTFDSVRIIDDCDTVLTGLGEFWLDLTVNDQHLRWPEKGTNEVDSGQSYAIGQSLTVRVNDGEQLVITGAGFEVDEFQTESMGSIRVAHTAGDGWGAGRDSQTSLAVCTFVLGYSIQSAPTATVAPTVLPTPRILPTPTQSLPVAEFNANLRSGPGTNYDVSGSVIAGEVLDIVGQNAGGSWYKLREEHWIAAYLIKNAPGVPIVETPAPPLRYIPISIESYANDDITQLFPNFPKGVTKFGDIVFNIQEEKNKVSTQCEETDIPEVRANWPQDVSISTQGIHGLEKVYILISGGRVSEEARNRSIGSIEIRFMDGVSYAYDLVAGENIRNWNYGSIGSVGDVSSDDVVVFHSEVNSTWGPAAMDLLTIDIPTAFHSRILESVVVKDTSAVQEGINTCLFFSAITLFARN